jgi:hypothetical protein
MPRDLAELLVPIRAVHAEVFAGGNERFKPEDLARGVWLSLGASDETLCAHPESARRRLFELGLELDEDVDHALTVLLDSFPATGRTYSSLAMSRASQCLRRHDDERAYELLNNIKTHHPGFRLPGRWLALLDAPRIGRIALRERGASDAWQRGFWLDRQRPVLVRTRSQDERSAVAREVELRRLLTMPSVAPLLVSGTEGSTVFIAVEAVGRPAKWWHRLRQLDRRQILALAREGVTLLATVFRVGVAMPDADPTRFLLDDTGRLWLLDLWGAQATDTPDAAFVLARSWCNTILEKSDRPPGLRRLLAEADSLASLHEILATY